MADPSNESMLRDLKRDVDHKVGTILSDLKKGPREIDVAQIQNILNDERTSNQELARIQKQLDDIDNNIKFVEKKLQNYRNDLVVADADNKNRAKGKHVPLLDNNPAVIEMRQYAESCRKLRDQAQNIIQAREAQLAAAMEASRGVGVVGDMPEPHAPATLQGPTPQEEFDAFFKEEHEKMVIALRELREDINNSTVDKDFYNVKIQKAGEFKSKIDQFENRIKEKIATIKEQQGDSSTSPIKINTASLEREMLNLLEGKRNVDDRILERHLDFKTRIEIEKISEELKKYVYGTSLPMMASTVTKTTQKRGAIFGKSFEYSLLKSHGRNKEAIKLIEMCEKALNSNKVSDLNNVNQLLSSTGNDLAKATWRMKSSTLEDICKRGVGTLNGMVGQYPKKSVFEKAGDVQETKRTMGFKRK